MHYVMYKLVLLSVSNILTHTYCDIPIMHKFEAFNERNKSIETITQNLVDTVQLYPSYII